MLELLGCSVLDAQVNLERPLEHLEQDLEASLSDGGVVPALAELVTDEGVLGPGELVPAEGHTRLPQLGADEIPAGVVDVSVLDAEDQGDLTLELAEEVDGVVAAGRRRGGCVRALVGAEGARVDVRREVADRRCYAGVELACGVSFCTPGDDLPIWIRSRPTAARNARWPPRHMPVAPIRPVHVGRVSR